MSEYEAVVCSDGETEEMKLNIRPYPGSRPLSRDQKMFAKSCFPLLTFKDFRIEMSHETTGVMSLADCDGDE